MSVFIIKKLPYVAVILSLWQHSVQQKYHTVITHWDNVTALATSWAADRSKIFFYIEFFTICKWGVLNLTHMKCMVFLCLVFDVLNNLAAFLKLVNQSQFDSSNKWVTLQDSFCQIIFFQYGGSLVVLNAFNKLF